MGSLACEEKYSTSGSRALTPMLKYWSVIAVVLGLCPKIQNGRCTPESVNVATAWLCDDRPTALTASLESSASTSSTVQVVWNLPAASAVTVHGVCEASVLGRPSM